MRHPLRQPHLSSAPLLVHRTLSAEVGLLLPVVCREHHVDGVALQPLREDLLGHRTVRVGLLPVQVVGVPCAEGAAREGARPVLESRALAEAGLVPPEHHLVPCVEDKHASAAVDLVSGGCLPSPLGCFAIRIRSPLTHTRLHELVLAMLICPMLAGPPHTAVGYPLVCPLVPDSAEEAHVGPLLHQTNTHLSAAIDVHALLCERPPRGEDTPHRMTTGIG
mmetsp:Transcript_21195/g.60545  ORF Transcript_21195/g.60545 Transcript_21195/m.60545 type:complete len:221 (-) Transcript_21195:1135-1797(-)